MPPRRHRPQPTLPLGAAIRELREQRGLSQEAVALSAGLEPGWLSRLEGGKHNPSWATVERIAKALDAPVSELAQLAEQRAS